MDSLSPSSHDPRWPHRFAVALVCATFPLIWVGGLVTTYGAGMAVPDWPGTYGYNLFLYPWQTWIGGPWDLFIEHGHRLLGALAGMLAIGLVIAVWRSRQPRSVRVLAGVTLVMVVVQGVLGGLRVLWDERSLALVHGCAGPAFFALTVAMATVTSRRWQSLGTERTRARDPKLLRLSVLTAAMAYVQLILGATLRHLPVDAPPQAFRLAVFFHLAMAVGLGAHVVILGRYVWRNHGATTRLARPSLALGLLMALQLALGCATWVVKYSWPAWFGSFAFAAHYTIEAAGMTQALVVTAHVATGSLIVAVSLMIALRGSRPLPAAAAQRRANSTSGSDAPRSSAALAVAPRCSSADFEASLCSGRMVVIP